MSSSWLPLHHKEFYTRSVRHRVPRINRTVLWLGLSITFLFSLHSILRYLRPEYNITIRVFRWPTGNESFVEFNNSNTTTVSINTSPTILSSSSPIPTAAVSEYEQGSNTTRRANAALIMLVRNSELGNALSSVKQLEERFNKRFGYPWVFLNEVPFTDEFKEKMSNAISGPVSFGLIPKEHWYQPDWIDEEKAAAGRAQMEADNVVYGGSVSYRNMCRFNSGFFYRHPLVQPYKWYWRVEPGVSFFCDTDYDPFLFMEENDKVYGFTISLYEWPQTVETLWDAVKEFVNENPHYLDPDNALAFLSDDDGGSYNMCHFWSNFEIANLDFWRGEAYSKFFEHLESKGGFYYERWGDAPVHSIGAALFARKDQIHFFDDIGYQHPPFMHCPHLPSVRKAKNCSCSNIGNFDYNMYSCLNLWRQVERS
ncbi:hypothetical protein V8D89_000779 [Ganoderma adspersum]